MNQITKRTVLIVDDNPANLYFYSRILSAAGYEVDMASSGLEGLLKINGSPDLIILDIDLPDIDGFEICRRYKNSSFRFIPVIQTSASFVSQSDFLTGISSGADLFLTSPVDPQFLLECIDNLITKNGARKPEHLHPRTSRDT